MPIVIAVAVVIWTTSRHEGSHALAASLEGATIEEVRLLPGIHPELGFYFGYVKHSGDTSWLTDAAPFLSDAALILATIVLLTLPMSGRARFLVVLFGLLSPLIDLAYNYQGGFWRAGTDVNDLFAVLPDWIVHAFFVVAMAVAVMSMRRQRRLRRSND